MKSMIPFFGAAGLILAAAMYLPAQAQTAPGAMIQNLLDKPAKIELANATLDDAFRQIEAASGLRFDLHQAEPGIDLLPYGNLTQITATLQGITWREALRALFKPLSLEFQAGQDQIFILPTSWLLHQPQRLTREELEALVQLQTCRLTGKEDDLIKQLHQATGKKFVLILRDRHLKEANNDIVEKILTSTPQTAAGVLDLYARRSVDDGCWYLHADKIDESAGPIEIVILPRRELTALKCQKRITVQYTEVPIQNILVDLARLAGVKIHFEPGCIDMVEDNIQLKSSLAVRACTLENTLETLAGTTGLAYEYGPDSLIINASENLKTAAQARLQGAKTATNPTLGSIVVDIPGTNLKTQFMLRQQYLEEQGVLDKYVQLRQDTMADFLKYLRNYKPAQPTSAPPAANPPAAPTPAAPAKP